MYDVNNVKSPYLANNNGFDSYGIDHSGFSLRDELLYQFTQRTQGLNVLKPEKIEQPEQIYQTESVWGYPNSQKFSQYEKFGRPYSGCFNHDGYPFGTLSAEFESGNNKNIINRKKDDPVGGYSYGTYQIETKKGTMRDFINYLKRCAEYNEYYNKIQNSGGYEAAYNGTSKFISNWKKMSLEPDFLAAQKKFIIEKKLKPAIIKTNDIYGLNINCRKPVIKDVLFSTVTQHGESGASHVFHNALGKDVSRLSDEDIINRIYDERSKVNEYFKRQPQQQKNNIRLYRYPKERIKALQLLQDMY